MKIPVTVKCNIFCMDSMMVRPLALSCLSGCRSETTQPLALPNQMCTLMYTTQVLWCFLHRKSRTCEQVTDEETLKILLFFNSKPSRFLSYSIILQSRNLISPLTRCHSLDFCLHIFQDTWKSERCRVNVFTINVGRVERDIRLLLENRLSICFGRRVVGSTCVWICMEGREISRRTVFILLGKWFSEGRLLGWGGGVVVAVESVLIGLRRRRRVHKVLIKCKISINQNQRVQTLPLCITKIAILQNQRFLYLPDIKQRIPINVRSISHKNSKIKKQPKTNCRQVKPSNCALCVIPLKRCMFLVGAFQTIYSGLFSTIIISVRIIHFQFITTQVLFQLKINQHGQCRPRADGAVVL